MLKSKINKIILIALVPFLMYGCDSLFDVGDTETSYSGQDVVELFPLQTTLRANNTTTETLQIQLIAAQKDEPLSITFNINDTEGVDDDDVAELGVHFEIVETVADYPQFSELTGTYTEAVELEIESVTVDNGLDAEIWYSLDGSTPGPGLDGSVRYTGPINITSTTLVKAITVPAGENLSHLASSGVSAVEIAIGSPAAIADPVFFLSTGIYTDEIFIPISSTLGNTLPTTLAEAESENADRIVQIFTRDGNNVGNVADPVVGTGLYTGPVRFRAPNPNQDSPRFLEVKAITAVSEVLRGEVNCGDGVEICIGDVIEQSDVVTEIFTIDLELANVVAPAEPGVYRKTINANSSSAPISLRAIKGSVSGGDEFQLIVNLEGGSGVPAAENLKRSTVFIR